MTRVTTYTRVRLTKHTRPDAYDNKRREIRTPEGNRFMKHVGECIKQGGAVQMQTWYEGWDQFASARLDWSHADTK